MTKRALKKLSRLERKFAGPNAGLVWGIWPLYFVNDGHAFHWSGVWHDFEYLLREMPRGRILDILSPLISVDDWNRIAAETWRRNRLDQEGRTLKTRKEVDDELLADMLEAAGEDRKLIITARIAYRVVRLLGGFWW